MIFLTTGTQLSFDRLVRAFDAWAETVNSDMEIFGQVLPSHQNPYVPKNFRTKPRLTPAEYAEIFDKAKLIVSHAGMGTILTALTTGKLICIMPRQMKFHEHRNDHQLSTVKHLNDYPGLFKACDEQDLPKCLDAALDRLGALTPQPIDPFAPADFTAEIRRLILAP